MAQLAISTPTASTPAPQDQRDRFGAADEMAARVHAASLDKVIAALPKVVDQAMQTALPSRYSPELAAQIAETVIGILTGTVCPAWPGLCTDTKAGHYDHSNHDHRVNDSHGDRILDVGFVQLSDSPVARPPVIYIGNEDLRPEEVRAKTAELRRLLDIAEDLADKALATQTAPEREPARTWTYTRRPDRTQVTVTCPSWCTNTHDGSRAFGDAAEDITHQLHGREATVQATDTGTYEDWRILSAQLGISPDDQDTARRTPHVQVELVDDVWSRPLDPDGLAAFIDTVAGQLAELRAMHARLIQARAEKAEVRA